MSSHWLISDAEDECMQGLTSDAQVIYMRVFRRYMNFATGVVDVSYGLMKRAIEHIPDRGSNVRARRVSDIDNNYIRARVAELERAGLVRRIDKPSRFDTPSFRCLVATVGEVRPKYEPHENHMGGTTLGGTAETPGGATTYESGGTPGSTNEPPEMNHKIPGIQGNAAPADDARAPESHVEWQDWFTQQGFSLAQVMRPNVILGLKEWVKRGVTLADAELCVAFADSKCSNGKPASPAYYLKFMPDVLSAKAQPAGGVIAPRYEGTAHGARKQNRKSAAAALFESCAGAWDETPTH